MFRGRGGEFGGRNTGFGSEGIFNSCVGCVIRRVSVFVFVEWVFTGKRREGGWFWGRFGEVVDVRVRGTSRGMLFYRFRGLGGWVLFCFRILRKMIKFMCICRF